MPEPVAGTALVVHGTAIAWNGAAVLLRGQSGAGKSDLALRCIGIGNGPLATAPAVLVADDRVVLTRQGDHLVASSPLSIRGRLEVRGVGIVDVPAVDAAPLRLVVDLVPPSQVERMPASGLAADIADIGVPVMMLAPFEASAPLKILMTLRMVLGGR